ncbi:hypothetical protein PsorP6_008229 [Peronosclerospora sorghi]|uniref:Uncharacterized protein n=1 Tax=Peronosclerospora sorghi TaxID=230839 RepID=A0ACC0WBC4_9STRA|nr:hypothetical protein PsorP6_008229 [Peronosclerospora sorghi]
MTICVGITSFVLWSTIESTCRKRNGMAHDLSSVSTCRISCLDVDQYASDSVETGKKVFNKLDIETITVSLSWRDASIDSKASGTVQDVDLYKTTNDYCHTARASISCVLSRALFQHFDPKTLTQLVAFALCEYRILLHSPQQSRLCPMAESLLCTHVPLSMTTPTGRPEHLVFVDIDRGTFELHESKELIDRSSAFLIGKDRKQRDFNDNEATYRMNNGEERISRFKVLKEEIPQRRSMKWRREMEIQVRQAVLCFRAAVLRGYKRIR